MSDKKKKHRKRKRKSKASAHRQNLFGDVVGNESQDFIQAEHSHEKEQIHDTNKKADEKITVLLIGDYGSGKTSLMRQFSGDTFIPHAKHINDITTFRKLRDSNVEVHLFAAGGQAKSQAAYQSNYKAADFIFICYNASKVDPFESLSWWIEPIEFNVPQNVNIMFVACQIDRVRDKPKLNAQYQRNREKLSNTLKSGIWQKYRVSEHECSSKTGKNVETIFKSAIDAVMEVKKSKILSDKRRESALSDEKQPAIDDENKSSNLDSNNAKFTQNKPEHERKSTKSTHHHDNEGLSAILKANELYDDLYTILHENEIELDDLKHSKEDGIEPLCEKFNMNKQQTEQFQKLMRVINEKHEMKIIIVGDDHVGKTSLLQRYAMDKFMDDNQTLTHSVVISKQEILYNHSIANLTVSDSKNGHINMYKKADCVLICYDLSNSESFNNVDEWAQKVEKHAKDGMIAMVVGCKRDISEINEMEQRNQDLFNKRQWLNPCECSAKTGDNVKDVFLMAADLVVKKREERGENMNEWKWSETDDEDENNVFELNQRIHDLNAEKMANVEKQKAFETQHEAQMNEKDERIKDLKQKCDDINKDNHELKSKYAKILSAQIMIEDQTKYKQTIDELEIKNVAINKLQSKYDEMIQETNDSETKYKLQIKTTNEENNKLKINITALEAKENEAYKELEIKDNELKEENIKKELETLQSQYDDAIQKIKQYESENTNYKQTIAELEIKNDKLNEANNQNETLQSEYDEIKQQQNYLETKYAHINEENNKLKINITALEAKENEENSSNEEIQNVLSELKKEKDSINEAHKELKIKHNALNEENKRNKEELESAKGLHEALKSKSAELTKLFQQMQDDNNEKKLKAENIIQELRLEKKEFDDTLMKERNEAQSKYDVLMQDKDELIAKHQKTINEIIEIKSKNATDLNKKYDELQQHHRQTSVGVIQKETELKQNITTLTNERDESIQTLKQYESDHKELETKYDELSHNHNEFKHKHNELIERNKQTEAELKSEKSANENFQSEYNELKESQKQQQKEYDALQQQFTGLKGKVRTENEQYRKELILGQNKIAELIKAHEAKQLAVDLLQNELKSVQDQYTELQLKYNEKVEQQKDLNGKHEKLKENHEREQSENRCKQQSIRILQNKLNKIRMKALKEDKMNYLRIQLQHTEHSMKITRKQLDELKQKIAMELNLPRITITQYQNYFVDLLLEHHKNIAERYDKEYQLYEDLKQKLTDISIRGLPTLPNDNNSASKIKLCFQS